MFGEHWSCQTSEILLCVNQKLNVIDKQPYRLFYLSQNALGRFKVIRGNALIRISVIVSLKYEHFRTGRLVHNQCTIINDRLSIYVFISNVNFLCTCVLSLIYKKKW